jgi:hypothetical protein
LEAARNCGQETIAAEIREGGRPEAMLCSCKANTGHGKRRNNADKRKAVEKLLKHPEWFAWSDGKIAEECAVSPPFVASLRKNPTTNPFESPILRLGIDGRVIDTSNIGKGAALMPPETEPIPPSHGEKESAVAEEDLHPMQLKDQQKDGDEDLETVNAEFDTPASPSGIEDEPDGNSDDPGNEDPIKVPPFDRSKIEKALQVFEKRYEAFREYWAKIDSLEAIEKSKFDEKLAKLNKAWEDFSKHVFRFKQHQLK